MLPATAVGGGTSMVGGFRREGDVLIFTPRHPFASGVSYAFVQRDAPAVVIQRPAASPQPSTAVRAIYPSCSQLPLNALRFYIQFTAPMSEGLASEHVFLRDTATGERLDGAFLPMPPELWDPHRTRLTVLLDPGRIKRGLVPNAEAGYPLAYGQRVELVVSASFEDATGAELVTAARRDYLVGPAVRRLIEPSGWAIDPLMRGTFAPLRVRFDRPLDYALAMRCLTVVDAEGVPVPGHAELSPGESEWAFTPASVWGASAYTLLVAPQLEDVAGNSVTRVFDRDLADPSHDPKVARTVALPLR